MSGATAAHTAVGIRDGAGSRRGRARTFAADTSDAKGRHYFKRSGRIRPKPRTRETATKTGFVDITTIGALAGGGRRRGNRGFFGSVTNVD